VHQKQLNFVVQAQHLLTIATLPMPNSVGSHGIETAFNIDWSLQISMNDIYHAMVV
jgi:hypothetical protein